MQSHLSIIILRFKDFERRNNMTKATVDSIRCSNDLNLYEKLLGSREVKKTNEWIERESKKNPASTRRHLLSSSVRLTEKMSPKIHAMAKDCIEKLNVELDVELYVFSSPQFNAACFKPEDDRLYVMFSSSLLEGFTEQELKYVMGHELGHHIYRHHDVPIGYLLKGQRRPSPRMALELFAWSRYAEISADRAGAHCAQDFQAVASALFKLSSGLTSDLIQFDLDDFLAQVDEMQIVDAEPGEGSPKGDWFSTHPFSPLRVKALQHFHNSEFFEKDGISKEQLEINVQTLMGLMEPSYLEGKTEVAESMRRLLFAGALTVADASGGISEKEIEVFKEFFGKFSLNDNLNIEKIKSSLKDRAEAVKNIASRAQCAQLVRDLILISKADDNTSKKERKVLTEIAGMLDVSNETLEQALGFKAELD